MARPKQQLQLMAFGGIAACVALYVFIQFVVSPTIVELRETRQETERLNAELSKIRQTVRDRHSVQSQIDEALEKFRNAAEHIPLPVLGNYLIEMEEAIRACVEGTGVDVRAVVEAGQPAELRGGSGAFRIFQTRVVSTGGLHDIARAFYIIEQKHPYVSVSGVTISPQDDDPLRHSVTFIVSWLIWADPEERHAFLMDTI